MLTHPDPRDLVDLSPEGLAEKERRDSLTEEERAAAEAVSLDAVPPTASARAAMDDGRTVGDECGVTTMVNQDGRIELFALGYDGAIHHVWQGNDRVWSNWVALAPQPFKFISAPHPIRAPDGRVHLFAKADDLMLYHNFQVSAGGAFSDSWSMVGGPFRDDVSVSLNSEGMLSVFAQGDVSRSLMYNVQRINATSEYWAGWANLGGVLTSSPSALLDAEGLMHVFVRGVDKALYFKDQFARGGSSGVIGWAPYDGLGGLLMGTPSIPAQLTPVNLLSVWTRQADGAVWYAKQTPESGSQKVEWTRWESLGGKMQAGPAVVVDGHNLVNVFTRGEDHSIYVKLQVRVPAGHESTEWHRWESLGGNWSSTSPSVLLHPDGSLHVYFRGSDQQIYRKSKLAVPRSDDAADGSTNALPDFQWEKDWTIMTNEKGYIKTFFRPFKC